MISKGASKATGQQGNRAVRVNTLKRAQITLIVTSIFPRVAFEYGHS
jgi:hypothetical protein